MLGDIFKNKDVWIFDLDNTLYSSKTKIFDQIDERMKLFISKKLNISFEKAFTLQKKFYKEYGTTLYGLMKHYNFQPKEFLNFVHDVNLDKITKIKICLKISRTSQEKKLFIQMEMKIMPVEY